LTLVYVLLDVEVTLGQGTSIQKVGLPDDLFEGLAQHDDNLLVLSEELILQGSLVGLESQVVQLELLHGLL